MDSTRRWRCAACSAGWPPGRARAHRCWRPSPAGASAEPAPPSSAIVWRFVVGTESLSRDEAAVRMWDGAYDASALGGQANLWGDPPVPYAKTAAELFTAAGAVVI